MDLTSITVAQWVILWVVGLLVVHFGAGWKDESNGLLCSTFYLEATITAVICWIIYTCFMDVGALIIE